MSALEMYWNSSAHIRASTWFRLEMMLSKFSSNFIITQRNVHWNSQFLHVIAQCQLALFHNMNKPLTWIHCDDDYDDDDDDDDAECEKVDMRNLVLIIVGNNLQIKDN